MLVLGVPKRKLMPPPPGTPRGPSRSGGGGSEGPSPVRVQTRLSSCRPHPRLVGILPNTRPLCSHCASRLAVSGGTEALGLDLSRANPATTLALIFSIAGSSFKNRTAGGFP